MGQETVHRQAALCRAPPAGRGSFASGDGGQPGRLHPVQTLRARVPRRTSQRRDRLRLPRRPFEDRVRSRRSDGRFHVRRLRRVRAGVSHGRADARSRGRQDRRRQAGRFGVSVLRRRLPAHLQHQGQHHPLRAGEGRSREFEPPVREGTLRLRLRSAQASPHQAADPQAGRSEDQGLRGRSRQLAGCVPRGHLGRSARRRRQGISRSSGYLRQAVAGRFRLRQMHQRRGVPLPEAGADRLRLEQRRPLHAPVPRIERRSADGRHQLGRGVEPGARRRKCGSDFPDRRESDGESSGRRDLYQERREGGSEADRRRPAPRRSGPARHLQSPVQGRYGCGAAQRDAARHRRGRPGGQDVHRAIALPATKRSPRT